MNQLHTSSKIILSLTSNEKGYFKRYVLPITKDSEKISALFDVLNKQLSKESETEPDLVQIRKSKVLKQITEKELKTLKTNLTNALIEGLVRYDKEDQVEDKIINLYNKARSFEKRKLPEEAAKHYEKAIEAAVYHQCIYLFHFVAYSYQLLLNRINKYKFTDQVEELWRKRFEWLKSIEAYEMELYTEHKILNFASYTGPVSTQEGLDKLDAFVQVKDSDKSLQELVQFQNTFNKQMFFWLRKDKENMFKYLQKSAKHHVDKPHLYVGMSRVNNLYNYLQQLILNKDIEKFETYFQHFKAIKLSGKQELLFYQLYTYIIESLSNIEFEKFEKNIALEVQAWEFSQGGILDVGKARLHMLCYTMVSTLFIEEKYDDTLKWVNFIKEHKLDTRRDTNLLVNILGLLCQYEMENFEYLPYFIRQTKYDLKTRNVESVFEKIMFTLVSNLMKHSNNKKEQVSKLNSTLIEIEGASEKELKELPFDIRSWIRAKIKDEPFKVEYLKAKQVND